jgi:SAM-dependent methyltransferase
MGRVGSKLKSSSERFDATRRETAEDVVMGLYHRYSYEVAARTLGPDDRVLDVGFGEGYASAILPGAYVGVELDPDLVAHARARYAGRFETYDGRHLPDGPFDLVVSFQVIEHVDDVDPWLTEIARVARRAMFATPNRIHRVREGKRPWNRYHVREFSAEELQRLLERHFGEVAVYGVHEGRLLARRAPSLRVVHRAWARASRERASLEDRRLAPHTPDVAERIAHLAERNVVT